MAKHLKGTPAFDLEPLAAAGALPIDPSVDLPAATAATPPLV